MYAPVWGLTVQFSEPNYQPARCVSSYPFWSIMFCGLAIGITFSLGVNILKSWLVLHFLLQNVLDKNTISIMVSFCWFCVRKLHMSAMHKWNCKKGFLLCHLNFNIQHIFYCQEKPNRLKPRSHTGEGGCFNPNIIICSHSLMIMDSSPHYG